MVPRVPTNPDSSAANRLRDADEALVPRSANLPVLAVATTSRMNSCISVITQWKYRYFVIDYLHIGQAVGHKFRVLSCVP